MDFKLVEDRILSLNSVSKAFPFGEKVAVYFVGEPNSFDTEKMFALIEVDSTPLKISLRCDERLAVLLRERYETVMPAENLNKKYWNTLLLTGQLPWEEVQGFIIHSYNIVTSA
jgi:predicted DNA-binding protein (MmcQ/YjbR family)